MLSVHLRDKNQIITMTCPEKSSLQGRSSHSQFYHTSIDFLCAALGTCAGGHLINYCRFNNLNVQIFESITVGFFTDKFIIDIKRPKDFEQEHIDRITRELENCPISKQLISSIEIHWDINDTPIKDLIKETKGCCGQ